MRKKIIISAIDLHIIDKIREIRSLSIPYVSQSTLSLGIGFAQGFIGQVESFSEDRIYSLRQLNLIANYFNLELKDFLPGEKINDDLLELEIEMIKTTSTKVQIDKYGNVIKNYRIINGRILTSDEIDTLNKSKSRAKS
ncbi:transcriptional regulator [Flavobacterium sp. xlx-214]|uniref:transcriptional regulator n=1 Tax=unclassified Flavobacterium TaxID=196869 RepID=UPI0013D339F4|nr:MULTISPECIES: transcriptional regulator [unclassified Flavobacterium]MBA5792697.1 transcriptional regulator [Flavobacterium sp. xlx-221]QMI83842.1 transcriptional regulator [Flavobacterium sp. xlx-214]